MNKITVYDIYILACSIDDAPKRTIKDFYRLDKKMLDYYRTVHKNILSPNLKYIMQHFHPFSQYIDPNDFEKFIDRWYKNIQTHLYNNNFLGYLKDE